MLFYRTKEAIGMEDIVDYLKNPAVMGAGIGGGAGLLSSLATDEEDEDTKLRNTILGALLGGGGTYLATNPAVREWLSKLFGGGEIPDAMRGGPTSQIPGKAPAAPAPTYDAPEPTYTPGARQNAQNKMKVGPGVVDPKNLPGKPYTPSAGKMGIPPKPEAVPNNPKAGPKNPTTAPPAKNEEAGGGNYAIPGAVLGGGAGAGAGYGYGKPQDTELRNRVNTNIARENEFNIRDMHRALDAEKANRQTTANLDKQRQALRQRQEVQRAAKEKVLVEPGMTQKDVAYTPEGHRYTTTTKKIPATYRPGKARIRDLPVIQSIENNRSHSPRPLAAPYPKIPSLESLADDYYAGFKPKANRYAARGGVGGMLLGGLLGSMFGGDNAQQPAVK